ncbi:MAG: DUF58 domain-containing protein [Hyphomicrobiales bacterium]
MVSANGTLEQATDAPFTLLSEAQKTAETLPDLLLEARRVARTIMSGWHGRRMAGPGESFWQFRPFVEGENAAAIDWRRSAREDSIYLRDREWEAAQTAWLWLDLTKSMQFGSSLAGVTKRARAIVLTLAITELLTAGGERTGLLGHTRATTRRNAAEIYAERISRANVLPSNQGMPAPEGINRFSEVVLFGDFLDPITELEKFIHQIARAGTRGHVVQVLDPVEEGFPYTGRVEFQDPESGQKITASRAQSYRDEYRERLESRRQAVKDLCHKLDWTFLVHHTDRPASEAVLTLYHRLAGGRV